MDKRNIEAQIEKHVKQLHVNPANPDLHLYLGLLYEEEGEEIGALKAYEQAVSFAPNQAKFLVPLGLLYTKLGRDDLAIAAFKKALPDSDFYQKLESFKYDPLFPSVDLTSKIMLCVEAYRQKAERNKESPTALANLSLIFILAGKTQEALGTLQKALRINSQFADAYHLQAYAYQQSALPELAAKSLEQFVNLQPEHKNAHCLLGKIYFQLERYTVAQKELEKALALDPKYLEALLWLGRVLVKIGRREQAIEQYVKVVGLSPKNKEAHFELAKLCEEKFDLQGAARHYRLVIDLEPNHPEAYHGLGLVCNRMGLVQDAVLAFQKAVELSPGDPYFRYHLGRAYANGGRHEDAVVEYQEALRYNPNDSYVYNHLGISHEKLLDRSAAIDAFKKAIGLNPDDTYAHYHLGLVYLADEQLSLAAGEFERVLELNPRDAFAYYNLGAAYARLGFVDKGIAAYQQAITLHPSSAYAHFNLGAAYARDGKPELAEEEFKKATALTPKNEEELALFATLNSQAFINIEMARLNQQLKELYTKTVEALIRTLDAKDHYTAGHTSRVSYIALKIARFMGFSREEMEGLRMGALLHDIGKIGIPEKILLKKEALTQDEYEIMKAHPAIGFKILSPVPFPWEGVVDYVKCHHEKVDGTGYPDALEGDAIPIGAQIIGLADFFDALATERPYKPALPIPNVMEEIEKLISQAFSLEVVEALKACIDDSIFKLYSSHKISQKPASQNFTMEEIELWNVIS